MTALVLDAPIYAKLVIDLDTGDYHVVGTQHGWAAASSLPEPERYPSQCIAIARKDDIGKVARDTFEYGRFEDWSEPRHGDEAL